MKKTVNILLALFTALMLLLSLVVFSAPAYTPEVQIIRVDSPNAGGFVFE